MNDGVYKRFFRVVDGPLVERARQLLDEREQVIRRLKVFGKRRKVEVLATSDGRLAFAAKKDQKVDLQAWRRERNTSHLIPRGNTTEGRALKAEIVSLGQLPVVADALRVVGLHPHFPLLIEGRTGYSCGLYGTLEEPILFFVTVPWRNIAPKEKREYLKSNAAGNHMSMCLDHLCKWQPHPSMREVKQWEYLKEIEERGLK